MRTTMTIYCDGLCEPRNPGGYACYGWVLLKGEEEVASGLGCVGFGEGITNNVAEYHALLEAVKYVRAHFGSFYPSVDFRTDSQLVVKQVRGEWDCKQPHLIELRDMIKGLWRGHDFLRWVPREQNEAADALSRRAYEMVRVSRQFFRIAGPVKNGSPLWVGEAIEQAPSR